MWERTRQRVYLPAAVAVATRDGADARACASADAPLAVSRGSPPRHCGRESGAARLGAVLSHGQRGDEVRPHRSLRRGPAPRPAASQRAGSRRPRSGARRWRRPFFEALGLSACAARFSIRGWRMPRPEDHLVSRVREIRTHGLNGGLAHSQSARRLETSRIYQCAAIVRVLT